MRRIRLVTWLVAVIVAICLIAIPADASGNVRVPANLQNRAQAVCSRIPNLLTRSNALLTRLSSGPDTHGSIALLRAKADLASSRKRAVIATDLNHRADVLTQRLAQLPNQLAALQQAQQTCESYGFSS